MIKAIPLIPASQTLSINISGETYNLRIIWRNTEYVLDLLDKEKNSIITGIALVTGCNLLRQYEYLNLGFNMFISTDVNKTIDPEYKTLGVSSHLLVYN